MNPKRSQRFNISGEVYGDETPIVLLVDDEAAVRDVLAWVIQSAGYTPVTAAGLEGFELLGELADRVALLILDLTMQGLDGFRFRIFDRLVGTEGSPRRHQCHDNLRFAGVSKRYWLASGSTLSCIKLAGLRPPALGR